jgi:hypothetical protein
MMLLDKVGNAKVAPTAAAQTLVWTRVYVAMKSKRSKSGGMFA